MSDSVSLSASEFTLKLGASGFVVVGGEGKGSLSVINKDSGIARGVYDGKDLVLEGVGLGTGYIEVKRGFASAKIKVIVV